MDQSGIDALMDQYRRPAIMVHRPFPPINLPPCKSHLGGRPTLPAGLDWPRTSDGTPLHFLAQIDCSELPSSDNVLPTSGVLFFFARIDEEMIWGEGDPKDDCRVLFAPQSGPGESKVPVDLPEVMFGFSGPVVDFKLPEEPPVQLYPRWPVTFHKIESWPDGSALPVRLGPDYKTYQTAIREARSSEERRVAGPPVGTSYVAEWRKDVFLLGMPGPALPQSSEDRPFPQVWVLIDRISRRILKQAEVNMWPPPSRQGPDPTLLLSIKSAAASWVAAARSHDLDGAPSAETSRRFAAWLLDLTNHAFFRKNVASAVKKGMEGAMQYAASAPRAAALIPAIYYQEMGERRNGRYHQMLGNTGSAQAARSVERDEVLLLQLKSDYGVNFMFCDVGEAEFWIDKRDLAARRFDKVFATTCGG